MKQLFVGIVVLAVVFCVFGCEQEPPRGTHDLDVRIERLSNEIEALKTTIMDLDEQISSLEASMTDVMDAYNTLAEDFEDHMDQYHGEKTTLPKVAPPKKRIK